ncbi:hypothetical protein [Shewanella sp. 125m-1]
MSSQGRARSEPQQYLHIPPLEAIDNYEATSSKTLLDNTNPKINVINLHLKANSLWGIFKLETEPLVPNFVQQLPRVDTAVTVHDMDVMAEPPGKDLLRVTVVSAHTPLEAMDKNMIDRHC